MVLIFYLLTLAVLTSGASLPNDPKAKHPWFHKLFGGHNEADSEAMKLSELDLDSNQPLSSLCWVETLTTTKRKNGETKPPSREYSVILETPANIPAVQICDEIGERGHQIRKVMNYNSVKETGGAVVIENRTLFCGIGSVLSKQYLEWPNLNKTRTEIKLGVAMPVYWKMCGQNITRRFIENPEILGQGSSGQNGENGDTNFDTTQTTACTSGSTRKLQKDQRGAKKTTPSKVEHPTTPFTVLGVNQNNISTKLVPEYTTEGKYEVKEDADEDEGNIILGSSQGKIQIQRGKTTKRPRDKFAFSHLMDRKIMVFGPDEIKNSIENTTLLKDLRTKHDPMLIQLVFPLEIFQIFHPTDGNQAFVLDVKVSVNCRELGDDETVRKEDEFGVKMEEESLYVVSPSGKYEH